VATTAILFDLDDTLFDHWACTRAALADLRERCPVLGRMPVGEVEAEHRRLLEDLHLRVLAGGMTVDQARVERFRRLLAFAGETAGEEAAADAAAAYRAAYLAHWRPVEGALGLLEALHGQVLTGIVTNNIAAEQRQKIAACGFGPLLDGRDETRSPHLPAGARYPRLRGCADRDDRRRVGDRHRGRTRGRHPPCLV
jgi:FMN phosphatase YigB (HAD superfamily)